MLKQALNNPTWLSHKIGDAYTMDGKKELWKIAYYPILEDDKEPKALIEKPILGKLDMKVGTDFREVPLRYLTKNNK